MMAGLQQQQQHRKSANHQVCTPALKTGRQPVAQHTHIALLGDLPMISNTGMIA